MNEFRPVIGLEVHVEQSTKSKMFCGCSAQHFGKEPNTQVCPVCSGLPGALPYANEQAIENTILFGLALGCEIAKQSRFDRKHYFYPDLPKGYQISQYDLPLCAGGKFEARSTKSETIRIRRVHLEEDTGKLVHTTVDGKKVSLVDFNRSGVPLMELVTEPDFENVDEIIWFLQEIQRIVRYLGISDADMEKGSMRLEANISLSEMSSANRLQTTDLPDYKVELKNINSFRFLRRAIEAEVERQRAILTAGKKVKQETRGFDEASGTTYHQRSKEEAQDYKYFPEPDIAPIKISNQDIKLLRDCLPELPQEKREKFRKLGLSGQFVEVLVDNRARAEYFETCVKLAKKHGVAAKTVADVMVNQNLDEQFSEPAGMVAKLVQLTQRDYASEEETKRAVLQTIKKNSKAVADYKKGKTQVIGFLVGQVQKELSGKGEPKVITEFLMKALL